MLHKKLCEQRGVTTTFTASDGWLWRFGQRHGIRQLTLQGEKLSADWLAAENFIASFEDIIENGQYTLNQIFNCDETVLYYKLLPRKSLVSGMEKSADGRKLQKERITINACSNASGSIKLPLFFIGKFKKPRCFKNVSKDKLSVIYASQKNAWMTASLFSTWFQNDFVPVVQKELVKLGVEPKAILLLDNCSAHPNADELVSTDGKIKAVFLPPNVTSLIQPMDQGILEALKRHYRRKLLEELLFQDDEGISIVEYLKSTDIVAASWDEIAPMSLQLSWRKFLSTSSSGSTVDTAVDTSDDTAGDTSDEEHLVQDCATLFDELGMELTVDEVEEWLQSDTSDQGYTHLNDDEIIATVLNESEGDEAEETEPDSTPQTKNMSHSEAIKMFDGCMQYLQEQNEDTVHNLTMLK